MFADIKRKELLDPHNPPAHAEGPFVISGQNRYVCFFFSPVVSAAKCREIIEHKLHQSQLVSKVPDASLLLSQAGRTRASDCHQSTWYVTERTFEGVYQNGALGKAPESSRVFSGCQENAT